MFFGGMYVITGSSEASCFGFFLETIPSSVSARSTAYPSGYNEPLWVSSIIAADSFGSLPLLSSAELFFAPESLLLSL